MLLLCVCVCVCVCVFWCHAIIRRNVYCHRVHLLLNVGYLCHAFIEGNAYPHTVLIWAVCAMLLYGVICTVTECIISLIQGVCVFA